MSRGVAGLLATGFGVGRLPWGPGTWGSAVGAALGLLGDRLLPTPVAWALVGVGLPVCAWICTEAERRLGQHDPPSVVLDELWAMAAILLLVPGPWTPLRLALAFVAFRVCDTLKPPPLKRLARLPAGWGIMMDDVGAALYAGMIVQVAKWLSG